MLALKPVPRSIARPLVPADVPIFCSACTRTLALLYVAHYNSSPVGEYRELIVAPALVRNGQSVAFWISHIVVDSAASVEAGRSIWALPKVLGSFQWRSQPGPRVELDSDEVIFRCEATPDRGRLRIPLLGAGRSRLGVSSKAFALHGSASIGFVRGTLHLSGDEGLRALGFERSQTLCWLRNMRLVIGAARDVS